MSAAPTAAIINNNNNNNNSNFRLSSTLKMEDEALVAKKQGIISILGSDSETSSSTKSSLRRTLSADMSSDKWLSQHGLKKTASSQQFLVSIADSCSSQEDDYEQPKLNVWEDNTKNLVQNPVQFDIWSSILSQKSQQVSDTNSNPAPYIHPLVKRSTSSLSDKSLQICTESLGSETGSDGFSSYPSSETGDMEEDKEDLEHHQQQNFEAFDVEKEPRIIYSTAASKYSNNSRKLPQRSFPPTIPSLSRQDGASLRMRTVRDNGRLVLEAVSVPSQNNFRAQRHDGRLVLTFNPPAEEDDEMVEDDEPNEFEELDIDQFQCSEDDEIETDDDEEEEEEEEMGFVMEEAAKLSSGVINVHRLALMVNKPIMGLVNNYNDNNPNQTWPNKINEIVKLEVEEAMDRVDPTAPLAHSLPPRPRVGRLIPSPRSPTTTVPVPSTATSLNAYEYYWRPKPIPNMFGPITQNPSPLKLKNNYEHQQQQQQWIKLRGNENGEYSVPISKGCKEPRRSILFWEHYCIATS